MCQNQETEMWKEPKWHFLGSRFWLKKQFLKIVNTQDRLSGSIGFIHYFLPIVQCWWNGVSNFNSVLVLKKMHLATKMLLLFCLIDDIEQVDKEKACILQKFSDLGQLCTRDGHILLIVSLLKSSSHFSHFFNWSFSPLFENPVGLYWNWEM